MPHDTPLITTIVAALVLAFIFGAIANRLKMPPLVGYLIAGVCVGPHSPGFIADQTLADQLAEIGVILLMFGVGLEFSLRDLLSVKAVAIPGALIRLLVATGLGVGLGALMGWPLLGGVVFGLALGVSSTVVTLKAMQERHLVDSDRGRIAIGWLVVEDLAMVLALVLIPAFAGAAGSGGVESGIASAAAGGQADPFVLLTEQVLQMQLPLWGVLAVTLVKLLAFAGFMIVVGRRIIPYILHATAHTGSRELFRLAVLAIALGVAGGAAYLFGVSLALGAFFAGMILSESELSHRAAQETLPLRDAFGVLFFVSVGMLFDPSIIVREPLPVLASLVIILFGKTIVGFLLLVLFRRPVGSALTISAALAQIGEFSFILVALGVGLGLMPEEGRGLILAGAIISIILNPLMFWISEKLRPRLEARAPRRVAEPELGPVVPGVADEVSPAPVEDAEVLEEVAQPTRLTNHIVLIGYGRVGTVVADELSEEGTPFVLIEDAEGRVHRARKAGLEVIVGNAAVRETLTLANVMGARCVVIAIPNAFEAGQATEQCRKLNGAVRIIARAHADEEIDYLKRLGANEVIMGEREIGLGMIDWLNGHTGTPTEARVPPLAAAENVLQQVRRAQPVAAEAAPNGPIELEPLVAATPAAAAVAELAGPPIEPILPPAAETPALAAKEESIALAPPVGSVAGPAQDKSPAPVEPETVEAVETAAPEPAGAVPEANTAGRDPVTADAAPVAESVIAAPPPTELPAAAEASERPPQMASAEPEANEAVARPSPGFRVVAPSDIIILPPDPSARNGSWEAAETAEAEPAATFRSEFWDEPAPAGGGDFGSPAGGSKASASLQDVRETAAARAAVEEGSWIEALERDIFGEEAATPEAAQEPRPIETPHPQETPVPPPEPSRPPPPEEEPQPPSPPLETPPPTEIPPPPPSPGQPPNVLPPEPRATNDDEAAPERFERKEPPLY